MKKLVLINELNLDVFDIVDFGTDLKKWAFDFINKDDRNIDFHDGGKIFINQNEIIISGDNGVLNIIAKEFNP